MFSFVNALQSVNLTDSHSSDCYISGKRSCLGESLARMELFLFISLLVQRFKFESAPGEKLTVDNVDGLFGIVHAPKPYSIVAVPRR